MEAGIARKRENAKTAATGKKNTFFMVTPRTTKLNHAGKYHTGPFWVRHCFEGIYIRWAVLACQGIFCIQKLPAGGDPGDGEL
jgi:hypothetical protein